jgi:trans-aconitate methyltransferase
LRRCPAWTQRHAALEVRDELPADRHALGQQLLDQVRVKAWDRVLFIECGDGWIVEEAWRRAPRAYMCGLDLSPGHTELAKRLREVPGRLEFQSRSGNT